MYNVCLFKLLDHPTCLDMTLEMVPYIKRYNWQCNECKSCAQCKEVADEDKMLFCDLCDRGYILFLNIISLSVN